MQFIIQKLPFHLIIAATTLFSKAIVLAVQIWGTKYFIARLNLNDYSSFVLLSAIAPWMLLSDFGIGSAAQNFISEVRGRSDSGSQYIFYALTLSTLLMLMVSPFFFFLAPNITQIYLQPQDARSLANELGAFQIATLIFLVVSLGAVTQKLWLALQKGWVGNLFPAIGSIISVILLNLSSLDAYNSHLSGALIVFYAPTAIAYLFSVILLLTQVKSLQFTREIFLADIAQLIKRSGSFWFFSLMAGIVLQADYIVLSQKFQAQDVLVYSIHQRIFSIIFFIYVAVLQALWPTCAEMRIAGRWQELKHTASAHILFGILGVLLYTATIYIFRNHVMEFFSNTVVPSFILIVAFGVLNVIRVWTDTFAMLLQSMNILKPLWIIVPLQAVLTLAFQFLFSDYFGLVGIVMGLIAGYILTAALFCPLIFFRKIRQEQVA
jgi:O-antigen/teichoic acid export membrane protein